MKTIRGTWLVLAMFFFPGTALMSFCGSHIAHILETGNSNHLSADWAVAGFAVGILMIAGAYSILQRFSIIELKATLAELQSKMVPPPPERES